LRAILLVEPEIFILPGTPGSGGLNFGHREVKKFGQKLKKLGSQFLQFFTVESLHYFHGRATGIFVGGGKVVSAGGSDSAGGGSCMDGIGDRGATGGSVLTCIASRPLTMLGREISVYCL
jgi:hypothetical protein